MEQKRETGENYRRTGVRDARANLTRRCGAAEDVREVLKISLRTLRLIILADFVRDPEAFLTASFCYAYFRRFGSPSANCVIPLTTFASLPPSIFCVLCVLCVSLWLKLLCGLRGLCVRFYQTLTQPGSSIVISHHVL